MLVDTDVLIWHLSGYAQVTRRLDELRAPTHSAVGYLEFLRGVRNKIQLVAVKKMFDKCSARLLPLTTAITLRTTDSMQFLILGHGLHRGDAQIAACQEDRTSFCCLWQRTKTNLNPFAAWQGVSMPGQRRAKAKGKA